MKKHRTHIMDVIGLLGFLGAASLLADGTETLAPPGITIQPGTAVIAAGTGLGGFSGGVTQPQPINLTVPAGATVKQVLLYWEGDNRTGGTSDNTITVNGTEITGTLIGGPTVFYEDVSFATFRADITSLNLVAAGANSLSVGGMANLYNNGAGVLVIFDAGTGPATIGVRDGQDLAFWGFAPTLDAAVPQTFTFPASASARTATLSMLFASAEGAANEIRYTINGVTTTLVGLLGNNSGPDWDTLNLPISIPAGATSLTVEPVSPETDGASLCWITGALSVPPPSGPPPQGACVGTPGFWKNHPDAWPVEQITVGGETYDKATAILIMSLGGPDKSITMFQQLVSAKLNVLHGSDPSCITDTIDAADAWLETNAPNGVPGDIRANSPAWQQDGEALKNELDRYNNGLLCATIKC